MTTHWRKCSRAALRSRSVSNFSSNRPGQGERAPRIWEISCEGSDLLSLDKDEPHFTSACIKGLHSSHKSVWLLHFNDAKTLNIYICFTFVTLCEVYTIANVHARSDFFCLRRIKCAPVPCLCSWPQNLSNTFTQMYSPMCAHINSHLLSVPLVRTDMRYMIHMNVFLLLPLLMFGICSPWDTITAQTGCKEQALADVWPLHAFKSQDRSCFFHRFFHCSEAEWMSQLSGSRKVQDVHIFPIWKMYSK